MLKVPCQELGCDRCCHPTSEKSGPVLGVAEAKEHADIAEVRADGESFIGMRREQNGNTCTQLKDARCGVYERRPFVCRTYPAMLQQGRLVLSLRCPWVSTVLVPRWGSEGMPKHEKETMAEVKRVMIDTIPERVKEAWDRDIAGFEVVLTVDV